MSHPHICRYLKQAPTRQHRPLVAKHLYSYGPRCTRPSRLRRYIFSIQGTLPHNTPPFYPSPSLKIQFIEFTYCNDQFPQTTTNLKLSIYTPLTTTLPIIIIVVVYDAIHKPSIKQLLELKLPPSHKKTFMTTLHQISIKYLTYLVLNWCEWEKIQSPIFPPWFILNNTNQNIPNTTSPPTKQ